jgi:hypothetical protein
MPGKINGFEKVGLKKSGPSLFFIWLLIILVLYAVISGTSTHVYLIISNTYAL